MLDRLVGLETEYALRFQPRQPGARSISNGEIFQRLIEHVKAKVPLVPAITKDVERAYFTGNGGAVRFERMPFLAWLPSAGLVEGATPECRGPMQFLRYQRAQDVLLSRAAAASGGDDGQVTLLKNNRDNRGSNYGSHENYEATVATGPTLHVWRLGLAILLPLSMPLLLCAEILCWLLLLVCIPLAIVLGIRKRGAPMYVEGLIRGTLALAAFPAALAVEMFVRLVAFRRIRREMLAFLVSRPIIAGAGVVDERGRFGLSPRALALAVVCSTATLVGRSVYYFNQVWKGLIGVLSGDRGAFTRLFAARQRLQLSVGDSNVAQVAEYLKVGTTLLVLDAIEADMLRNAPVPPSPLTAMRAICADPSLQARVHLSGGRHWNALEIQRFYLAACRRHVARAGPDHPEAVAILDLWEKTLNALEDDPDQLIGKIDWVTKRYLLAAAGEGASLSERRKIDARYHELSQEGYYLRLEAAGIAPTVIEPEDVLSAIDTPPSGTPAAQRGRLIRELADNKEVLASWSAIIVGSGKSMKTIQLTDQAGH